MRLTHTIATSTLLLALGAPAIAQKPDIADVDVFAFASAQAQANDADPQPRPKPNVRIGRGVGSGIGSGTGFKVIVPPIGPFDADALYDQAREAIENSQFDRAIRDLDRVLADSTKSRADAAMYWKAYSQVRIAEVQEALRTIQELSKDFANSPWVKDAKALAVEIQSAAGQPVSAELQNDEELKLLALRGVMQADPDKGVPIVEKMLAGGASPRVRDRALFVLSQTRSARAREVILNTAKNNSNPDLQRSAIR